MAETDDLDIYALIERKGLSLRKLAERTNLSHSMLSQALRGKKSFSAGALERVAFALDMSPTELLAHIARMPAPAPSEDALRERQSRDSSVRVGVFEVVVDIDDDGTAFVEKRYLNCRPALPGRPGVLTMRDRAAGMDASKQEPRI